MVIPKRRKSHRTGETSMWAQVIYDICQNIKDCLVMMGQKISSIPYEICNFFIYLYGMIVTILNALYDYIYQSSDPPSPTTSDAQVKARQDKNYIVGFLLRNLEILRNFLKILQEALDAMIRDNPSFEDVPHVIILSHILRALEYSKLCKKKIIGHDNNTINIPPFLLACFKLALDIGIYILMSLPLTGMYIPCYIAVIPLKSIMSYTLTSFIIFSLAAHIEYMCASYIHLSTDHYNSSDTFKLWPILKAIAHRHIIKHYVRDRVIYMCHIILQACCTVLPVPSWYVYIMYGITIYYVTDCIIKPLLNLIYTLTLTIESNLYANSSPASSSILLAVLGDYKLESQASYLPEVCEPVQCAIS